MQQPSAQGIASLYRGNPQPLQQTIQKEQQAKPGLPPDLQKLLALQIVNNEKDGFAAQKAMQQLKQMSGPQGTPPTVMQSLQQQAEQKMQAQAQQQAQQQQGLQALAKQAPAGPVPAGTPQPEAQPEAQGIDQLPVDFQMAEGGVVAFAGGGDGEYETRYDKMNRENRERDAQEAERAAAIEALVAQIPAGGPTVRGGERVDSTELSRNVQNALAALPGASATRAVSGGAGSIRGALAGLAGLMNRGEEPAPAAQPSPKAVAPRDNRALLNAADAPQRAQRAAPTVSTGIKALADMPSAAPKAAGIAATPAPAPAESEAMALLKARMADSPDKREAAEVEKYKRMVGAPDTAQHDRLIAELEKRKQELAPKSGYAGLMEYLGEISANSQPGRGSFASGAAGARAVNQLNKERAGQQFELSKQAIEVSQKKLDTVRAYAEKTYGIGKTAFDQVFKDQHDAAKEIVKDESAARQLAQQNTLKMLEMQNELKKANIMADSRTAGGGSGDKQQLAELKALQKQYADQMKTTFNKGDKAALQAKLNTVESAIAKMAGLDTMLGAPGAASPGGTSNAGWGKAQVVNP